MGLTAAVVGGSALLGTGAQLYSSSQAAGQQRDAAASSNALIKSMYDQTRTDLSPYRDLGSNSSNQLMSMLPQLTQQFNPTMDQLSQTPGYQFTLDQGLKAVNNSNSGQFGAGSGPLGKGIAQFATGLASQTYNQQFQNYWTGNQNAYNMLLGPTQLGANAGAVQAGQNFNTGNAMGGNIIGAGNAAGAASLAQGNAVAGAPINALTEYSVLDRTLNPQNYPGYFGGGGGMNYNTMYAMGT